MDLVVGRAEFSSEEDKKAYVCECEEAFERKIDIAVESITADDRVRIVTLSGPTCSGKTTTANKLTDEFTERGRRVHVISIDNFYYDRALLVRRAQEENRELDLDSADTIDLPKLQEVIEDIFACRSFTCPVFDFVSGVRLPKGIPYTVTPRDVFVFEGIQAVYPEVTGLFGGKKHTSVFISVGERLKIGEDIYGRSEIRFMRRLVRDYLFRSAQPDFTYHVWESVRANEKANILPYADACDYTISSLLPYEVNMLTPYLREVLSHVNPDGPYHAKAETILQKIRSVEPISKDYIPTISMYHEFLG